MTNLTEQTESYRERVRESRIAAGFTQRMMADALGIPLDRYKKYENRSPMPSMTLARFAAIVRRDATWLLTGDKGSFLPGNGPRLRVIIPKTQPPGNQRRKR